MPRGGARPNSGPKKGFKMPATLDKEAAREALRALVKENLRPMVEAQVANAKGINHFFLRDDMGRFVKIDDPKAIETALNAGEEGKYYWIFTKDPSIQAFTDLMNRTLDKPAEHVQMEANITGSVDLVERLAYARKRANRG